MYPILLVFVAGMAISVERWVQLNRIRNVNRKMWNVLHPVLVKGEFDKARALIKKDKSTISQMLGMGLARQGTRGDESRSITPSRRSVASSCIAAAHSRCGSSAAWPSG